MVRPLASRSTDRQGRHSNVYHHPTCVSHSCTLLHFSVQSLCDALRFSLEMMEMETAGPMLHLHYLYLLYAVGKATHRYDNNRMTTETLQTVIQYKYKHYEKWTYFLSVFIQNVRGALATNTLFLLFNTRFWLHWMLSIEVDYWFDNSSVILKDIRNIW